MSKAERRVAERIPVSLEVELHCCNKVHQGKVTNMSSKGMFVSMDGMCFPFESTLNILIFAAHNPIHVPVSLRRIEMNPDSRDGIGVELSGRSVEYSNLIDTLKSSL